MFIARQTELAGALSVLEQQKVQREQDLIDAKFSIETLVNTQGLIAQEIELIEPLVRQAIAPETRLLELRRELERTRGAESSSRASEARAVAGIAEVKNEIRNRKESYVLSSMQELSTTVAELSEIKEAMPSLEERVSRTIVRAPVTGIVNRLNFRTPRVT